MVFTPSLEPHWICDGHFDRFLLQGQCELFLGRQLNLHGGEVDGDVVLDEQGLQTLGNFAEDTLIQPLLDILRMR